MALVEVEIMRLGLDRTSNSYVVILREKGGDRILPIWIGQAEAESIVVEMHHMHRERPLTHDLCKTLITALGAILSRVHVTRVVARTYFAEMHLTTNEGALVIDARPSDSIAIALRFSAQLFAEESLLTNAIVEESDAVAESDARPESDDVDVEASSSYTPMTPDELKAYLENLRPEDFGKFHF